MLWVKPVNQRGVPQAKPSAGLCVSADQALRDCWGEAERPGGGDSSTDRGKTDHPCVLLLTACYLKFPELFLFRCLEGWEPNRPSRIGVEALPCSSEHRVWRAVGAQ